MTLDPEPGVVELEIAGTVLHLRRIQPEDAPRLVASLALLSDETRVGRFFFPKRGFSVGELAALTHCDGVNHSAFVALLRDDTSAPLVAVARWLRDDREPTLAEVAFVTRDDWQGHGLGRMLIKLLADDARAKGITHFWTASLWGNFAAVKLLESVGTLEQRETIGAGAFQSRYRLG